MGELWCPVATKDPGTAAGYKVGHTAMRTVKMHYTAGTDSYNVCKNGRLAEGNISLCQFLFPKIGHPWQFAEIDALCYDSGTWNGDGPGLEFERLSYDEVLTPDQITYGGQVVRWLNSEWGFPLTLWDGPRVIATDCGFINHGSVLGRGTEHADHSDGVTRAEWNLLLGTPTPPPSTPSPGDNTMQMLDYQGTTVTFHIDKKGQFVQNTYQYGAGHTLVDKVVLAGNNPAIQPAVAVHNDVISVATVDTGGRGRFFSFLPGTGWVDANGNALP